MADGVGELFAGFAYVDIRARLTNLGKDIKNEVDKATSGAQSSFQTLAGVGKAAFFGIAGGALAAGAASIAFADQFEAAHARLETALKNVGASFDVEKAAIDSLDTRLEKLGFTHTETQSALARLIPVTKNAAQAIGLESLAADIARGRHISLEDATSLLVKVQTGHVALLGRLGIATKDATGHTISQEEAIKRLSALYGGQASAYTATFAGKMAALKATSQDLAIAVGQALIPIIERLAQATLNIVNWFEKHRAVAIALGVAVGSVLVVAIGAFIVSLVTATATIGATEVALAPLLLAIAAVGVGIFELATHWHQYWDDIKTWIGDAVNWIRDHTLAIILLFGPVGVAVELLAHNWRTIWKDIQTVVEDVWNVLRPIFGDIARAAGDVAGAIGKVVGVAEKVGGFVGKVLSFAEGGWVPGPVGAPSLAVVHGGEYVLSREMLRSPQAPVAPSLGGGFGGSMVEALMRDLIAAVKNGHEVTIDGRTLAVVGSQGLASRRRSRS